MQTLTDLAARLKPFMMRWIDEAGGGAGGAPSPHDLDSAHHGGSLADSQATQFLKTDGTRTLTGNLTVSASVTIDGVDISAHEADSGAHHAQAHDLSGPDHMGSGLTVGYVIRATGATTFAWAQLQHGDLGGLGEDDHHVAFEELGSDSGTAIPEETNDRITLGGGIGITTSGATNTITISVDQGYAFTWTASHIWDDGAGDSPTLSLVGGSNNDTVTLGLEDDGTAGYSDFIISLAGNWVQAGLIVRSQSGAVDAFRVGADGTFEHAGPGTITTDAGTQLTLAYDGSNYAGLAVDSAGDLTIQPTGDLELNPLSDDVLPTSNYEINLGSLQRKYLTIHAAELWVETLVAQDTIATIGGRILVGPTTIFEADLASGTTHGTQLVLNPGFETAGGGGADVFANWTEAAGTGTITQSTTALEGTYACSLLAGASVDTYVDQTITVTASTDYEWLFYTRGDGTYGGRYSVYDVSNSAYITTLTATGITAAVWAGVYHRFTTPSGCVSIRLRLQCPSTSTGTAYFDSNLLGTPVQITVKHNQMSAGDVAYSEANAKVEFMVITSAASGSGPYTYYVRRDLDGTGANDWYEGDALFNTGTTDDGFMDLYSYSGITSGTVGPTIVGNVRTSPIYNDWSEGWAIGNLTGLYGQSSGTYGVGLGRYGAGYSNVVIDPTNGVRLRTNTVTHIALEADGDVFIGEDVSAAASTNIAIFTNAQNYNGEAVAAGDVLIGDNSAAKANIFWDKSAGKMQFRGGTTMQCELGTDGALYAGGGAVTLDTNGIVLTEDGTNNYLYWVDSNDKTICFAGLNREYGTTNNAYLWATFTAGDSVDSKVNLVAYKTDGDTNWLSLGSDQCKLFALGGPTVGLQVTGGLYVGGTVTPDANDIHYEGNLKSMKNGTHYDVYGFVPLTTSLTSTSWDGDSYSTTAKTLIDLSAVFGAPAGIKAVLFRVLVRDSGASTTDCWINLGLTNVSATGVGLRCMPANDRWSEGTVVVPCDANGDIYYQIGASGASTMDVYLQVWGYWI